MKRTQIIQMWDNIVSENIKNEELVSVANDFFKPDYINPIVFFENIKIAEAGIYELEMYQEQFDSLKISPTMHFFKEYFNRPTGFPLWFMAAYPDVVKWASININKYKEHPYFKNCFSRKESFIKEDLIKTEVLRLFINFYKENVINKLECALNK